MHKLFAILYLTLRALEARIPEIQVLTLGDLVLRYSFLIGIFYVTSYSLDLINEVRSKFWLVSFLVYIGISVLLNTEVLSLFPLYAQLLIDLSIGLIMVKKIDRLDFVLKFIYIFGTLTLVVNFIFLEQITFLETVRNHKNETVRVFGLFGDSFPFYLVLVGIKFFKRNKIWLFFAFAISIFIGSFGAWILALCFFVSHVLKLKPINNLIFPFFLNAGYVLCLVLLTSLYEGVKSHSLSLRLDTILFAFEQLGIGSLMYSGYGLFSIIEKPSGIFANVTNQYVQWLFELGIIGLFLALLVYYESIFKGSRLMSSWIFLGLVTFTWFIPGYLIVCLIMLIYEKENSSFYNYN